MALEIGVRHKVPHRCLFSILMNPAIQFQTQHIVITTRGFLDFLTFGRWRKVHSLDFSKGVLEEQTIRFSKTTILTHYLRAFDAIDYSYQLLNLSFQDGEEREHEEFRVGLRCRSTGAIVPLASFRGSVSTPTGLAALLSSAFPSRCAPNIRHEVEARSLANQLCGKLGLKLAD